MNIYDIDGIIREALRKGIDISPADRQEWRMFCCALKVLGYDEATFVALSSGAERDSRQAWRAERSPHRYKTEDTARGMIVELAKSAGIELNNFRLSPYENTHRNSSRRPTDRRAARQWAVSNHHTAAKGIAINEPPKPQAVYITPQQVSAAQAHAHETSLYIWLCSEFDRAEVNRVFSAYYIGGSKFAEWSGIRATAFPYIDKYGRCVDCHLMHFSTESGSSKEPNGKRRPNSWAIAELTENECKKCKPMESRETHKHCPNRENCVKILHRANWCYFGEHLLAERPTDPIGIVESEKSALILSLAYPKIIWIATNGKSKLNAEMLAPYRGRRVTLYPDRDGFQEWKTKAMELAAEGFVLSVDTTTQRHSGSPNDDLADIVLRYRHGEQEPPESSKAVTNSDTPDPQKAEAIRVFEDMKKRYPPLAQLAEILKLEPISVEPYHCKPKDNE